MVCQRRLTAADLTKEFASTSNLDSDLLRKSE